GNAVPIMVLEVTEGITAVVSTAGLSRRRRDLRFFEGPEQHRQQGCRVSFAEFFAVMLDGIVELADLLHFGACGGGIMLFPRPGQRLLVRRDLLSLFGRVFGIVLENGIVRRARKDDTAREVGRVR